MKRPCNSTDLEKGFSLVELMVAAGILAFGLVTVALLQVSALRSTHMSYMRTQAVIAAMEMADRMRANKPGVDANNYAAISGPAGTAPASCITGNCLEAAMAAYDAYTWLAALENSGDLVNATGTVTCLDSPCAVGSVHEITVMWDGRRNGATGTGCNNNDPTDLLCHRIRIRP